MKSHTFAVVRNCCTSGNCFHCTEKTPYGVSRKILHADNYDEKQAKLIAANWSSYKAEAIRRDLFAVDGEGNVIFIIGEKVN